MAPKTSSPPLPRIHRVAVLAFDGVVLADLAVPCELFGRARDAAGRPLYAVQVCAPAGHVRTRHVGLRVQAGLRALSRCDTVIVPGHEAGEPPAAVVEALRKAVRRGSRVASVCTGAFLLAATGALDGLRATTHWMAAEELARRHRAVQVDPDVLFVDHGNLLTSAGAAASHDLCLHMIRRDFGTEVAAAVARAAVMPLERWGGQAQYIVRPLPDAGTSPMARLLAWLDAHLDRELGLAEIARAFAMSTRTLSRHFRHQVGMTPARWIALARVRRAQALLEGTSAPVERIAQDVGFGSATVLRQRFAEVVGTTPTAYRQAFRRTEGGAS